MDTEKPNKYTMPVAIVFAGVLIAGAILFTAGGDEKVASSEGADSDNANSQPSPDEFRMPSDSDHVRGDVDAPITVVEFVDLECPFCARLHPTLKQIIEENDDVKWVFRHFPLSSHRNALSAAVAAECIAQLGGNDHFWAFTDAAFESQDQLGFQWYDEMAVSLGIDAEAFASCMEDEDGTLVSKIGADFEEARAMGGTGTPYSIVVTPNEQLIPFSGALRYDQVSAIIEQARNN